MMTRERQPTPSRLWTDDRGLSIFLAALVVIIVVPALGPVGLPGRLLGDALVLPDDGLGAVAAADRPRTTLIVSVITVPRIVGALDELALPHGQSRGLAGDLHARDPRCPLLCGPGAGPPARAHHGPPHPGGDRRLPAARLHLGGGVRAGGALASGSVPGSSRRQRLAAVGVLQLRDADDDGLRGYHACASPRARGRRAGGADRTASISRSCWLASCRWNCSPGGTAERTMTDRARGPPQTMPVAAPRGVISADRARPLAVDSRNVPQVARASASRARRRGSGQCAQWHRVRGAPGVRAWEGISRG